MDPIEKVAEEILLVVMAEHWARFYYAMEQDGVVFLDVPGEAIEELRKTRPVLADFITSINGQPLNQESSQRSVGEFVFQALEGGNLPAGTVAKAFDSKQFALLMRLFSVWLSGHEEQFDAEVMPFLQWEGLFTQWRRDPAVLRFGQTLADGGASTPSSGTTH